MAAICDIVLIIQKHFTQSATQELPLQLLNAANCITKEIIIPPAAAPAQGHALTDRPRPPHPATDHPTRRGGVTDAHTRPRRAWVTGRAWVIGRSALPGAAAATAAAAAAATAATAAAASGKWEQG